METIWFGIVTLMLAIFVVLDGFDLGVGIVYLFAARSETDRRMALMSIGPVWNGNEVWLIAGGGLLFFAFPKVFAAGFSGFYLALIIVLWLLIVRGLALELRSHLDHPIWTSWWDGAFSGASFLLAFVFGAALGNLIRGVPLNHDGLFFVALWTNFQPGSEPGILDWFTILMGLTSTSILALHGANYLAMKGEGDLYRRANRAGRFAGWITAGLATLALLAVPIVQPSLRLNFAGHPVEYLLPLTGSLMLGATLYFRSRQRDQAAFLASSLFILSMLASVACGMYPHLLISSTDPALSLTAFNAATDSYGLASGLAWFAVGFILLLAYQIYAQWVFRGKVRLDAL